MYTYLALDILYFVIQEHKFPPDFRFDAVKKKERRKKVEGEGKKFKEGEKLKKEPSSISSGSEKVKSQSAQPATR